ncbi:MAG TPA: GDSL-type esterase/lipase family protein [Longimicrobium sp.]|nr:GDSL-type esterase/lipase family protein [Longimicrobium sp.]
MTDIAAPSASSTDEPPRAPDAPPQGARRRSGVLLALGSLAVSLLVAEAGLRLLHPLADPYGALKQVPTFSGSPYVPSAYPPHYHLRVRAEPGLPGIDRRWRRFTLNNLGLRGDSIATPKPAGEFRIFVVGGSTTECIFLDDREALTARLQAYLRLAMPGVDVRVYGAGKSGDRSWDHVAMMAHRIAHLQPDVVVVFAGINDVMAGVAGRDYLLRAEQRPLERGAVWKMALSELQLGRLVHAALARPSYREAGLESTYRQSMRFASRLPERPLPRRPDPAPYAENLASLAGMARAQGARVVLMTQATTWNTSDPRSRAWHWMQDVHGRYPEADLDAVMGRYNDAMRAVGAAQGVPVFGLDRVLPKTADYIYDDVHFNVRGADTAARLLATFMVEQRMVHAPDR